jgi:alkanesulfonate monooxygenase SsuD/methylene tetrahydromethanopterin reductase-like flavin-dependent oxidoreductase (luciferase family)
MKSAGEARSRVNFDPMMTWPKPVQKPHPPIMVGGAFPYGARRALSYGNGWMPRRSRTQYADVQALLPKFREMATEAGRDLASSATATTASHAWSSASIPPREIRSCRSSIAGRI